MLNAPTIKTATPDARYRTMNTLLLGFAADPLARWFFPDPSQYMDAGRRFAEAFGGRAFDHSTAYVADDWKAVALWLPPGVHPDEQAMEAAMAEASRRDIADDMNAVFEGMAKYHPDEPHWYLPMMAADPMCIGQGLGAALLKHALRRCDADGLPAYLESSNPRNISLYERHGFEIIGEIRSGSSPVVTPMLRPAG